MLDAEITLTTKKPEPPEADFAFYIDFKRGEGSASRVFSATHDFIRACESLDRELLSSIDSNIETVMVLEDIEAGSLKTWLRNSLYCGDPEWQVETRSIRKVADAPARIAAVHLTKHSADAFYARLVSAGAPARD